MTLSIRVRVRVGVGELLSLSFNVLSIVICDCEFIIWLALMIGACLLSGGRGGWGHGAGWEVKAWEAGSGLAMDNAYEVCVSVQWDVC